MTYTEWETYDNNRRKLIINKLQAQGKSTIEIVDYFDFDNMKNKENNYCDLYKTNTKCHDIEKLNCFFCGCPYFKYDDDGLSLENDKTIYSKCTINAIKGSKFITDTAIHHDCSNCIIPHRPTFVYTKIDKYIKELNKV